MKNLKIIKYLLIAVFFKIFISSCNFTPGVPVPPPPRENFYLKVSEEPDCRGIWTVEVSAIPGTFETGEFCVISNVVSLEGVIVPAKSDGSILAFVPAAHGENIAIRRRTVDGDESLPILCTNPPPFENKCIEPPP